MVGLSPTISTSSFTLMMPRSMRPVTTVPRPEIENTSSTGIRKGLSTSRLGIGMYLSISSTSFTTEGTPISLLSPSSAFSAEPMMIGVLSPGNLYTESSSRDHVLHVVGVPGAVHVRVVTLRALVLHVRRGDRDPARLFLRRLVNLV